MKNFDLKDLEILVTTQDFQKQVEGYGLTTANILYPRPDHPWLLQSYVWQNYDLYPDFPELRSFWGFGRNLSKCPVFSHCCAFRAEIKQWVAFSGFIDQRLD